MFISILRTISTFGQKTNVSLSIMYTKFDSSSCCVRNMNYTARKQERSTQVLKNIHTWRERDKREREREGERSYANACFVLKQQRNF